MAIELKRRRFTVKEYHVLIGHIWPPKLQRLHRQLHQC